jgi:iron complex outermembrane receptor protein
MRSKSYFLAGVAGTALMSAALSSIACAQTTDDATVNEIVVTAQKRSQRTADVPISITALGGEQLAKQNITQSDQLVAVTPGLAWGGATGKSKPAIFLRGVGVDDYRSTSNSPVGTYSDGVYMGNSFGYGQLVLDVDRIEVLRGPQGTLWGKNTTGGVINYVPRLAQVGKDANGSMEIGGGNYGSRQANAAFGAPVGDTLAVRFAAGVDHTDGYYTSSNPAAANHLGGSTWYGLRGSAAYEPTSNVNIVGELNYSNLKGDGVPLKSLGTFDPTDFGSFTPCASPTAGRLGTSCADAFGDVSSANPYEVSTAYKSAENVETFAPILKAEVELGDYTLNSLTSYTHSKRHVAQDADFSISPEQWNFFDDNFRSYSQELRLSSPTTEALSWMVGLYAYGDRSEVYNTTNTPAFAVSQIAGLFTNKSQSYGAFADATYHATEKLNVTLGLRMTRDQRQASGKLLSYDGVFDGDYDQASVLANNTGTLVDFSAGTSRKNNNLSGRFVVDYHFNPRLMAFASYSRGFKGGDLNSGAQTASDFYITGPEHLTAYEVGLKGDIVPGVVSVETSTFYYDYQDAQVYIQSFDGAFYHTTLSNAGKLKIYGLDGNVNVTPTHRLAFDFSYAYLNSTYKSYVSENAGVDLNGDPIRLDYTGNVTPYASKWQLFGRASYTLPLGGDRSLEASVNAAYRSKVFFTSDNDPLASQSAYTLVDANLAFSLNRNVTISGWIKNIGDRFYWTGGYSLAGVGNVLLMPGAPRTFGASLRYTF